MNRSEMNLKPSSTLAAGDVFTYRGEVGIFVSWNTGMLHNRYGMYRQANVVNADGHSVVWSLNQAGSVQLGAFPAVV